MRDEQDAHQTPRTRSSSRPSLDERAPRYWPRGSAAASAAPRSTARARSCGSVAAIRTCVGSVDAIERTSDALVQLGVSDSGPGPGDKVRQRLFDPFVSEKVDGVGLGLSVVQSIARQHGAEVKWGRVDGWTHFRVGFPASAKIEANGGTACPSYS